MSLKRNDRSDRAAKGRSAPTRRRSQGRSSRNPYAVAIGVGLALLAVAYLLSRPDGSGGPGSSGSESGGSSEYPFQVGSPGPGESAPDFALASTAGGAWTLSEHEGNRVLLYFQEGVMCQPCWDQLRDIEANMDLFEALGIDEVATITVDPLDSLRQKAELDGLRTPLLADPDLAASKSYDANSYGMMGEGFNGHSFVLIGPDGTIEWRADYGGAPSHIMYLPVNQLVTDMKSGGVGA